MMVTSTSAPSGSASNCAQLGWKARVMWSARTAAWQGGTQPSRTSRLSAVRKMAANRTAAQGAASAAMGGGAVGGASCCSGGGDGGGGCWAAGPLL
jgi:hypothetical protein